MLAPKTKSKGAVSFADGYLQPLEVDRGRTITGNAAHVCAYGDETVGFSRFYTAQQAGVTIDRTCSIPFDSCVKREQYLEMIGFRDGKRRIYKVEQVQEKADTAPPSLLLSLSEVKVTLADEREESEKLENR